MNTKREKAMSDYDCECGDCVGERIKTLRAENERLKEQNSSLKNVALANQNSGLEVRAKLQTAVEALKFYAERTQKRKVEVWDFSVLVDKGDKARKALEQINE